MQRHAPRAVPLAVGEQHQVGGSVMPRDILVCEKALAKVDDPAQPVPADETPQVTGIPAFEHRRVLHTSREDQTACRDALAHVTKRVDERLKALGPPEKADTDQKRRVDADAQSHARLLARDSRRLVRSAEWNHVDATNGCSVRAECFRGA